MPARKVNGSWYVDLWIDVPGQGRTRLRKKSPVQTKKGANVELKDREPMLPRYQVPKEYDGYDLDQYLVEVFSAEDPAGRAANKAALQETLGLPIRADRPLLVAACGQDPARATLGERQGWDLLCGLADVLDRLDVQVALLAEAAAPDLERVLGELVERHAGRLVVRRGYDGPLLRRLLAGGDLWLEPARVATTASSVQLACRYGCVPVVRATGALDEVVVDHDRVSHTGTGFKFELATPDHLGGALERAVAEWQKPGHFRRLVQRVMRQDHSWALAASRYEELYRNALHHARS
jgi:starch synthase